MHAHLTVSAQGHVFITDLRSLHGTMIIPQNIDEAPLTLCDYIPTQLLDGDTLILGKTVHAENKNHPPIKVIVKFAHTTSSAGPNGTRLRLPPWNKDSLEEHFASEESLPRIEGKIRLCQSLQAGKAAFVSIHSVESSPDPVSAVYANPLLDMDARGISSREGVYGVPHSVLYASSDEEDLPRGNGEQTRENTSEGDSLASIAMGHLPSLPDAFTRPPSTSTMETIVSRPIAWSGPSPPPPSSQPPIHAYLNMLKTGEPSLHHTSTEQSSIALDVPCLDIPQTPSDWEKLVLSCHPGPNLPPIDEVDATVSSASGSDSEDGDELEHETDDHNELDEDDELESANSSDHAELWANTEPKNCDELDDHNNFDDNNEPTTGLYARLNQHQLDSYHGDETCSRDSDGEADGHVAVYDGPDPLLSNEIGERNRSDRFGLNEYNSEEDSDYADQSSSEGEGEDDDMDVVSSDDESSSEKLSGPTEPHTPQRGQSSVDVSPALPTKPSSKLIDQSPDCPKIKISVGEVCERMRRGESISLDRIRREKRETLEKNSPATGLANSQVKSEPAAARLASNLLIPRKEVEISMQTNDGRGMPEVASPGSPDPRDPQYGHWYSYSDREDDTLSESPHAMKGKKRSASAHDDDEAVHQANKSLEEELNAFGDTQYANHHVRVKIERMEQSPSPAMRKDIDQATKSTT